MENELKKMIERLQGPILVLGASGFIGANLFRMLLAVRPDIFGTASRLPAWRLEGYPEENVAATDLLVPSNLVALLDRTKPMTVFDCVSYGAYSFERDPNLIYRTNLNCKIQLLEELAERRIRMYVHAGSSSEYGSRAAGPKEEEAATVPNSHYAASKAAISAVIKYMGKERGLPCANLRLYSIYGPYEDSSRLVPSLVCRARENKLPPLVDPRTSRDFVYIDDACAAFIQTALNLPEECHGESFNIGSGRCLTIAEVAAIAIQTLAIKDEPQFSMPGRDWDVVDWFANPEKAAKHLGWRARTSFEAGLRHSAEWAGSLDLKEYIGSSKKFGLNTRHSVSAIIACYRDSQAIPIMYKRLSAVFARLNIDYEIIFVNDCSPDDSEEIIRAISNGDRRVIGISHSRNFGSQAAFRSGMELSTKNSCVLLDGDLQDPPELIEKFVEQWQQGHDVVFGRRIKREAPWYMQLAYKSFYRLFDTFSYIRIPRDAGDFSLMDKRVVRCLLQFPERDLFLRGIRAYAGFKQTGVDYIRPERMFGATTNSFFKNVGWAKKGILSFTKVPLNILSSISFCLVALTFLLGLSQIVIKLLFPSSAPTGVTTMMLLTMFFGSINLLAISLVGEYIAKIFEEVKRRPHFLRRAIIRDGEIRDAADEIIQIARQRGKT